MAGTQTGPRGWLRHGVSHERWAKEPRCPAATDAAHPGSEPRRRARQAQRRARQNRRREQRRRGRTGGGGRGGTGVDGLPSVSRRQVPRMGDVVGHALVNVLHGRRMAAAHQQNDTEQCQPTHRHHWVSYPKSKSRIPLERDSYLCGRVPTKLGRLCLPRLERRGPRFPSFDLKGSSSDRLSAGFESIRVRHGGELPAAQVSREHFLGDG